MKQYAIVQSNILVKLHPAFLDATLFGLFEHFVLFRMLADVERYWFSFIQNFYPWPTLMDGDGLA